MCGGVDRCWSHDTSAVNRSLCYFPCSAAAAASTSTLGSAAPSSKRLCVAQLDRAPSVAHRRPATPRLPLDGVGPSPEGPESLVASPAVSASDGRRPRSSPLLCLVGVSAALLAAAATRPSRNCGPSLLRVRDDGDFPTSSRDAGEFPPPDVDAVCSRKNAASAAVDSNCESRSRTSESPRRRIRPTAHRTIES